MRHAELVIKELGLIGAKMSRLPGSKEEKRRPVEDRRWRLGRRYLGIDVAALHWMQLKRWLEHCRA